MRDRHACARKLNGTRLTLMEFLAIVPGVSAWDIESPVQDGRLNLAIIVSANLTGSGTQWRRIWLKRP